MAIAYGAIRAYNAASLAIETARKTIGKQNLLLAIKEAVANVTGASAKSLGIAAAIALTAGAATYAFLKADDMFSPGYGERTLMGPEGAIQLNNKDTVIAGTNLFGGGSKETPASTINTGEKTASVDMSRVEAKLEKLISIISAGGDVYLDGNKVGSAQVLGTYKSS